MRAVIASDFVPKMGLEAACTKARCWKVAWGASDMPSSVTDIFDARTEEHPDRVLFRFVGGDGAVREQYTYGSFYARTNHVARRLLDAGIPAGAPALLVYPPGIEMAVAFFACMRVGIIPAPTPPPPQFKRRAGWERLAHIAEHAGARHALTTTAMAARIAALSGETDIGALSDGLAKLRWTATDDVIGRSELVAPRPSEVLFVQYTSGSTSAPRGVAVTHANAIHNASLCVDHDRPIGVSWLPHFHDMGLLGYFLFSVIKGGEANCFSPLDFLRKPVLWLELISRTHATITTAPNSAFEYCLRDDKIADEQLEGIDLGSLREMVNAAEPVRAETFERFHRRFSRCGLTASACVAGYGLAEHTLCVTTGGREMIASSENEAGVVHGPARLVSCGRPAPDVDVRIVDPQTRTAVAVGAIGEIWVDSPSKAAGYWRQPALTRQHFRAQVAGEPIGRMYLRTGDLGFLRGGELYVCGRLRDMLVLNGKNVFPADIEALLEKGFPRVLASRVVAFGTESAEAGTEHLVVMVEAGAGVVDLDGLRSIVLDGSGVLIQTIARVARGTIVRTSSGKIARQLCRNAWESMTIHPLEIASAPMNVSGESLGEQIAGLLAHAETLGIADATLDQLGLDSVAFVNLSLAIEEALEAAGLVTALVAEHAADLSLLQALRVEDLRMAYATINADASSADAIFQLLNIAADKVRGNEQACMRADAEEPLHLPARNCERQESGNAVLLTGATGFLGGFLLRSLIELTGDPIAVLVRCDNPAHGVARIRQALLDADMTEPAVGAALMSRVTVVQGDLGLARLGLADPDWEDLSRTTRRIYHSGAEVDYVRSYNLLRPANVTATREVIALAAVGQPKELHHISTTFIFGWTTRSPLYENDQNAGMEHLDFGYAQSKWVAEQLVHQARDRGLAATIYRPALITASAGARFVKRDVTARVLGYMIRHGLTVDAGNQVSFLPVDVCARNIIALSLRRVQIGPVLHMTCDEHHSIAEICTVIGERFGYRFSEVSLESFVAHAHAHCRPDDELYPLLSFLDRNTPRLQRMGTKRYDSSAYRSARDSTPLAVRHPSLAETLDPIVVYLQREGLVPLKGVRDGAEEVCA